MKNFNKKIYALNMASLKHIDSNIPKKYFKLAYNIANSFSKEYASIGVSNINDLIQESFLALLISWRNIKWDLINKIEDNIDRKKAVTNYLKKSINH